jgi:hypothetical protein
VFRGTGRMRDTATGRERDVPLHELDQTRDSLNRQAGYDKWVTIPPGEP